MTDPRFDRYRNGIDPRHWEHGDCLDDGLECDSKHCSIHTFIDHAAGMCDILACVWCHHGLTRCHKFNRHTGPCGPTEKQYEQENDE